MIVYLLNIKRKQCKQSLFTFYVKYTGPKSIGYLTRWKNIFHFY